MKFLCVLVLALSLAPSSLAWSGVTSSPTRSLKRASAVSVSARKRSGSGSDSLPVANLPKGCARPKLVVFDLDNTLWTPELYQLKRSPKADKDVWLYEGAKAALLELATEDAWKGTRVAIASRTNKVEWARHLLEKFEAAPGVSMAALAEFKEIFPGSKRKHFQNLKRASGVAFSEMIFFDDSTMNTNEIETMGVLCVFCPRGLTSEIWEGGLLNYAKMKEKGSDFMGGTISFSRTSNDQTAMAKLESARMQIPSSKLGLFIGKGGRNIKKLEVIMEEERRL